MKKRFSPYSTYTQAGRLYHVSTAPDGRRLASPTWHDDRIADILSVFEITKLKALQPGIIRSILSGDDTLAVMPTGSGKSLCFQAPALFFPGITLVITPLIALIDNQVNNFNAFFEPKRRRRLQGGCLYPDIHFKAICPGQGDFSARELFAEILQPQQTPDTPPIRYKLLYVSPERLTNPKFLRALDEAEANGLQISHIVIDEIHCMSQWGFDFRESYLSIGSFIRRRPIRPIISGFTATATPRDIAAIKSFLDFPPAAGPQTKYQEFISIVKRPNLSLHILECADDDDDDGYLPTRKARLLQLLTQNPSRVCIIYRTTVAGIDELYEELRAHPLLQDRLVKYHAQMPRRARNRSKNAFLHSYDTEAAGFSFFPGRCKNIMIATKAFGMGIDKQNISQIIHYDIPRSLEDYYQEVGRAGRDTAKVPLAQCWLLCAMGPKAARGTLQFTVGWVTNPEADNGAGFMPVYSQFSEPLRQHIYFWSYYRLCYVMRYCQIAKSPQAPPDLQDFIIDYLQDRFSPGQTAAALQAFYSYIMGNCLPFGAQRAYYIANRLFTPARAVSYLDAAAEADMSQKEIKRLVSQINELHINNTYAANLLRHRPQSYRLGEPYILEQDSPGAGQEWKSRRNKRINGRPSRTLRPADIQENSAFIFADPTTGAAECQEYVNAAWKLADKTQAPRPVALIFTVDYFNTVCGVLKTEGGSWRLLSSAEALGPYRRYIGCNIKGLFSQEQYGWWRKNRAGLLGSGCPIAPELFAFAAGARQHQLSLTIHGDAKPSYFDMCVLDAIYSIEISQKGAVYVQTIWQLLTGRNPRYSSREKQLFHSLIRQSIAKMRGLAISIRDNQCNFEISKAPFLPLLDKPKGQKGYGYSRIPPLFLYAEKMNGQIIKVPVSLLNVDKLAKAALWKQDLRASLPAAPADAAPRLPGRLHSPDGTTLKESARIARQLRPQDSRRLEELQRRPYRFSPSVDNALLSHYLLHRIAISKNRKRGGFILFSTIREVTGICEDSGLFTKKIAALLCHYRQSGYLSQYYAYIRDYTYRLAAGGVLNDLAYFQIEPGFSLCLWEQEGWRLAISDFTLTWSEEFNRQMQDNSSNFRLRVSLAEALGAQEQGLAQSTAAELAAMPLARMDGVALRHN